MPDALNSPKQKATDIKSLLDHRERILTGVSATGVRNLRVRLLHPLAVTTASRFITSGSSGGLGTKPNKHSTLNVLSGTTNIGQNPFSMGGGAGGSGTINLSGGGLILGRSGLVVGNAGGDGTGTVNITGGDFRTRGTLVVNPAGTVHVAGSSAGQVGIGSEGSVDGSWDQAEGSMLRIGLDAGGSTYPECCLRIRWLAKPNRWQ